MKRYYVVYLFGISLEKSSKSSIVEVVLYKINNANNTLAVNKNKMVICIKAPTDTDPWILQYFCYRRNMRL